MKSLRGLGFGIALVAALMACGEDTAPRREGGGDDAPLRDGSSDGFCNRRLTYMSPGCDGTVAPMCTTRGEDASLSDYCDCGGRTVPSGELGPGVPYRHVGSCGVPDGSPDGCTWFFTSPGCDANATATCRTFTPGTTSDPLTTVYCGCDGVTHQDRADGNRAPYRHVGACR